MRVVRCDTGVRESMSPSDGLSEGIAKGASDQARNGGCAPGDNHLTRVGGRIRNCIERVPLLPVLIAGVIALDSCQLPEALNFPCYAFGDCGANFTAQYLVAHGARPAVDFGFHYGLLSLLFGRVWFGLVGSTPYAYVAANFVVNLAIVWALARFARALDLGAEGKLLILAGLGYATYFQPYPDFAHMMEAALLVWALAEQARGARLNAIALAALAALAKPTMAYLYGAILIGLSWLEGARAKSEPRRRQWLRLVRRGALVGTVAAALLATVYGPEALVHTVLPLAGARAYRDLGFGFFSQGNFRVFMPGTRYWLASGAAFWALGGAYLLWYGARSLWSLWMRDEDFAEHAAEVTGSCAVMQLSFVMFFFANAWSWFYYSYLIVIGAAAATRRSATARAGALLLCAFALLGYRTTVSWTLHDWIVSRPSAETAGLWAPPDMRAEWSHVLELTHGRRSAVLARLGAAALMFPQFEPPVSWVLVPGLATQGDVRRKAKQISKASMVVLSTLYAWPGGVPPFVPLREALDRFHPIYAGRFFSVLKASPVRTGTLLRPRSLVRAHRSTAGAPQRLNWPSSVPKP